MSLHQTLTESARRYPDRIAIEAPDGSSIGYAELDALSNDVRNRLLHMGIAPGDRVGVYLHKSIDTIAAIFGILKAGAAYVPVDPTAPASRNSYILSDCTVAAVIVATEFHPNLILEFEKTAFSAPLLLVDPAHGGLADLLDRLQRKDAATCSSTVEPKSDDLAYILYTSGSTGRPKGVMISIGNAESFVAWCLEVFEPTPEDRFSSHAPFHFDLSILDIYTSLASGATLVLIPNDIGKEPVGLAKLIADRRISIWYSAPSILSLLCQYGKLDEHDYSNLRIVLFAGEVFPISHLRTLKEQLPLPRYFNLYGPTETNVCTWHEIPRTIPEDRSDPFPIGAVCSHLEGIVVDPAGQEIDAGEEGELCIAGASVLRGYWNLDEQTRSAFLEKEDGKRWYRTGDLVVEESPDTYRFVGRRDRMVKKRGYRVELGEIETCLYRHEDIQEAAVIAVVDDNGEVTIRAHLATLDGQKLSMIKIKRFCSETLPLYMVPDGFRFHAALPKTSTDKIDYQALSRLD
ncbi:MAG: amino acid adenylation domain-containing protein [bacterium]|nr:amino acid adenylation domain-containing protein [bacterium]